MAYGYPSSLSVELRWVVCCVLVSEFDLLPNGILPKSEGNYAAPPGRLITHMTKTKTIPSSSIYA